MMDATYSFGEWMKRQRRMMGLTQREVAERAHCSVVTIKKIEADSRRPSPEMAQMLANTAAEYIQKSHILSLDVMYDVSQRWTLGGKYAHRYGQLSQDRVNPQFFSSAASLYVLRADWHFLHKWDALIEARLLDLPDAGDRRSGALLGVYRHFNQNLKGGVGYNFTDFSDDLTDLNYDSQGFFVNVIGKF